MNTPPQSSSPPGDVPTRIIHLHADSPMTAVDLQHLPKEVSGQSAAYFWADGIRAGTYVHPAGKFELHVDRDRIDTWIANFQKMRQAGIDVPVPVDHSDLARDNLGYVVDMQRDGDTLKLLHQLIGDDAAKLAARNKISLAIDPEFVDGQGRAFGDCVIHSSLTPIPIVPGQGQMVAMSGPKSTSLIFELAQVIQPPAPATSVPPSSPLMPDQLDRMNRLVMLGRLLPANRDRLIRFTQKQSVFLASRNAGEINLTMVDEMLSILESNHTIATGEITGLQMLSRIVPDEDSGRIKPELQSKMIRMANGG